MHKDAQYQIKSHFILQVAYELYVSQGVQYKNKIWQRPQNDNSLYDRRVVP